MYLPLNNVFVWKVAVNARHAAFFHALCGLLSPEDIVAFGCYEPSAEAIAVLAPLRVSIDVPKELYSDSIAFNKDKHPDGEVFFIQAKSLSNPLLAALFTIKEGELLFFDHVMGFRLGHPALPLFMFHDANTCYWAEISGHYDLPAIRKALGGCGFAYQRVLGPQVVGPDFESAPPVES